MAPASYHKSTGRKKNHSRETAANPWPSLCRQRYYPEKLRYSCADLASLLGEEYWLRKMTGWSAPGVHVEASRERRQQGRFCVALLRGHQGTVDPAGTNYQGPHIDEQGRGLQPPPSSTSSAFPSLTDRQARGTTGAPQRVGRRVLPPRG